MQSELLQGCAFLLFFFAAVWKENLLTFKTLIFFLLGLTVIIFFHPLTFIPFFFLWLYGLTSHEKQHKAYYILPIAALLLLLYKHFGLPANSYDQQAIGLSADIFRKWWAFFSFRSTKRFLRWCLTHYYYFPILLAINLYYYRKTGQQVKLLLLAFFCLGYLFLVNSTFRWGPEQLHMESFYQILALFVLVPFVLEVLPSWKRSYQLYFIFSLICIRLLHITLQHRPYTDRLHWNQKLLEKTAIMEGKKFMTQEEEVPMDTLIMTWASPYETLLLSALAHPDSSQTVMIANPDLVPVDELLKHKKAFLSPYGPIPLEELPKRYFHLLDTSHYRLLLSGNNN